jgi:hypothetical protein
MPTPSPNPPLSAQNGAITILVALSMLILLTLAALSMSRNAFRDIISSGFARQAALTRNVADSGIEWAVYWSNLQNAPGASGSALALANQETRLLQDDSLAGVSTDIITGRQPYAPGGPLQPDLQWTNPTGVTGFTVGLTRMGKLPSTGMSQGLGPGAYAPANGNAVAQDPDLWAIRSDAQVQQGSVTFVHGQEAWVSTPVR